MRGDVEREAKARSRVIDEENRVAKAASRKIGDSLYEARLAVRLNQDDFGVELGVSRRTISRYEAGVTAPDPASLPWIAAQIYALDPEEGVRFAVAAGVASPAPSGHALNDALVAAAERLGVPPARMVATLAVLVAQWTALGATLDQIAELLQSR
jgi:transcriptional regulator with XRE-family HTH domain